MHFWMDWWITWKEVYDVCIFIFCGCWGLVQLSFIGGRFVGYLVALIFFKVDLDRRTSERANETSWPIKKERRSDKYCERIRKRILNRNKLPIVIKKNCKKKQGRRRREPPETDGNTIDQSILNKSQVINCNLNYHMQPRNMEKRVSLSAWAWRAYERELIALVLRFRSFNWMDYLNIQFLSFEQQENQFRDKRKSRRGVYSPSNPIVRMCTWIISFVMKSSVHAWKH